MSRKIGISVSVTPDQADWLDEQDETNSEIVRDLIRKERGVEA